MMETKKHRTTAQSSCATSFISRCSVPRRIASDVANLVVKRFQAFVHAQVHPVVKFIVDGLVFLDRLVSLSLVGHFLNRGGKIRVQLKPNGCVNGSRASHRRNKRKEIGSQTLQDNDTPADGGI